MLQLYTQLRDFKHGAKVLHPPPPLFIQENGHHPSRTWFNKRFFSVMDRSYGGQSAHAGGATFYANLGISEDILQAIG
jgi:hypothetical protein